MKSRLGATMLILVGLVDAAEPAQDYLRKQPAIVFFPELAGPALPELESGGEDPGKPDLKHVRDCVFDLVMVSRNEDQIDDFTTRATGFSLQVGKNVLLAGPFHALREAGGPLKRVAILAKGADGRWLHVVGFEGVSAAADLVLMKPSIRLEKWLPLAPSAPAPLDGLITCGKLGRFEGLFRRGEMLGRDGDFLLTSLPATRGTSGSPVLNGDRQLVGMITDVLPVLRQSGLYGGDHFAETLLTRCHSFHSPVP